MVPNLLSQAVVIPNYIDKLTKMDKEQNYTGAVYIYAMIFRKVVLFDVPEMNEDLDDLQYYRGRNRVSGPDDVTRPIVQSSLEDIKNGEDQDKEGID